MKTFRTGPLGLPCFYCNVDSTELKYFVIALIGTLVLSTALVGIGLWLKGVFRDPESWSDYPLKVEEQEETIAPSQEDKNHELS